MRELTKRVTQVGYGLAVAASLLTVSPLWAQVADSSVIDSTFIVEEVLNLPTIPEATLRERLPRLQRQIPLPYNKVVHNFIDYFTFRKPSYTRMVMERMPFYFPMYEKTLAKYNMPDELKYLSIVESALNPRAVSRAGAGGLWQFMPYTGKDFKLFIDEYTDDRMDPQKATEAACRYLKELYGTFGDWEMALAAYNCGPGAVRRAMRRTGGTTFWSCYEGLPKETRSYVPQFIAIAYMMNYGPDHGIVAEHPDYPIAFDTVQVNSYLDLKTFADLSQMPIADLRKLNPAISTDRLPDYTRDFALRVPSERMHHFQSNRRMIMDSASKLPVLMANMLLAHSEDAGLNLDSVDDPTHWRTAGRLADAVPVSAPVVAENDPAKAGQALPEPDDLETVVMHKPKKQSHTVRHGETLSSIAERYRVEMYDLMQWNHLHSRVLKSGQKLTVLREAGETHAERMAEQVPEKAHRKAETTAHHERERPRYHRVQNGDTLWNIAQRYGLLSIDKLKKINHIKGNSVRPGQKLLVG